MPDINQAKIIKTDLGLRSGRQQIRLEKELLTDGRYLIHNYGQGGSGFALSWGCATEVAKIVDTVES